MRVARQGRRRVAYAVIVDHAGPHHERLVHAVFALGFVVDLKSTFAVFPRLTERDSPARAAARSARKMQHARAGFRQRPLPRRAPFLTLRRVDGAEVNRRLAIPAVVDVLEITIEET